MLDAPGQTVRIPAGTPVSTVAADGGPVEFVTIEAALARPVTLRWVVDGDETDGGRITSTVPTRSTEGSWIELVLGEGGPNALVRIELEIDPGQAFGTGHHETTAVCLEALDAIPLDGRTVLDVGTGSGVLAIATARAGITAGCTANRRPRHDAPPGRGELARLAPDRGRGPRRRRRGAARARAARPRPRCRW